MTNNQDAYGAMYAACVAALECVKTAAIYDGAKAAGMVDSNGAWPLHNILAGALRLADCETPRHRGTVAG